MLSVITVCYNGEKTIERTIKSVLNQSTNQVEHIFIDGNSRDRTVSIIESYRKQYEDKGIKMSVISEKDNGIYDAMNKGIRLSTGSAIGFLNSDDWYEPDTVSIVLEEFKKNVNADIVMGSMYIQNRGKVITKIPHKSFVITSRNFNHPAMFVTRECYQNVGSYINDQRMFGDFDWYLRALKKKKNILYIRDVLVDFSVGGVSTKKSLRNALIKIKYRYSTYRDNGYSKLYFFECVFQELAKYCLIRR